VSPRTGLDDVEVRTFLTLPGLELRPVGRPAQSQSLYRLHYPGSIFFVNIWYILFFHKIKGIEVGGGQVLYILLHRMGNET
jgi:hypothetical protein